MLLDNTRAQRGRDNRPRSGWELLARERVCWSIGPGRTSVKINMRSSKHDGDSRCARAANPASSSNQNTPEMDTRYPRDG
jgi:hypothetical protein